MFAYDAAEEGSWGLPFWVRCTGDVSMLPGISVVYSLALVSGRDVRVKDGVASGRHKSTRAARY